MGKADGFMRPNKWRLLVIPRGEYVLHRKTLHEFHCPFTFTHDSLRSGHTDFDLSAKLRLPPRFLDNLHLSASSYLHPKSLLTEFILLSTVEPFQDGPLRSSPRHTKQ